MSYLPAFGPFISLLRISILPIKHSQCSIRIIRISQHSILIPFYSFLFGIFIRAISYIDRIIDISHISITGIISQINRLLRPFFRFFYIFIVCVPQIKPDKFLNRAAVVCHSSFLITFQRSFFIYLQLITAIFKFLS